jgi:hypothetical protein
MMSEDYGAGHHGGGLGDHSPVLVRLLYANGGTNRYQEGLKGLDRDRNDWGFRISICFYKPAQRLRNAGVEGSNPFISTNDINELGHAATWPFFFLVVSVTIQLPFFEESIFHLRAMISVSPWSKVILSTAARNS